MRCRAVFVNSQARQYSVYINKLIHELRMVDFRSGLSIEIPYVTKEVSFARLANRDAAQIKGVQLHLSMPGLKEATSAHVLGDNPGRLYFYTYAHSL